MRLRFLLPLIFILGGVNTFAADWMDQSPEIFLTKKLNAVTARYREFPVFWWNFIVVDGELTRERSERFCKETQISWGAAAGKFPCNFSPAQLSSLTQDWLSDVPGRVPAPGELEWRKAMNAILAKASMPLPRELLELMRKDPLDSLGELKRRLDRHQLFDLPMKGGMISDPDLKQIWFPVQLNYSPADSEKTATLLGSLNKICGGISGCKSVSVFGPHFSNWENETRIRADIGVVSTAGTFSLVLLAAFVVITRRQKIVLLMPILLLGLGLAAAMTVAVFGKIHGITLAFGPGIVGLAMDYGVHAVFMGPRSKATWKSNLAGLLTTLVILVILIFSQIPLLRQMMFFSAFGLILSFGLFYGFLHLWPALFETKPYGFTPKTWITGEYFAMGILVCCLLIFLRPLDLSVQHLNYESPKTISLRSWFAKHSTSLQPYMIEENGESPLETSHRMREWSEQKHVVYEGLANFYPKPREDFENRATWKTLCSPDPKLKFTTIQKRFFEPFVSLACAKQFQKYNFKNTYPDYVADFTAQGRWVSLLFPVTPEQVSTVKKDWPEATTPRDIFNEFPKIFMSELTWMVPVAFLLALVFLFAHFRSLGFTFLAVVPFFTGVGCYAIVAVAFTLPLSFISLIGLLMVFGFSLDYGIFVVDLLREHNENKFGVWSALNVCSFSAVAGFAPLIFAGHPVLNDLGQTLLWGSLGTFIGTFWGIPGLYRRIYE